MRAGTATMKSRNHRRSSLRPRTPRDLMDQLEQRTLMSGLVGHFSHGGLPTAPDNYYSTLEWDGAPFKVRTGSWLVNFTDMQSDDSARARAADVGARMGITIDSVTVIARGRYARIQTSSSVTPAGVAAIRDAGIGVTNIQPDRIYELTRVPNDPFFSSQWWLDNTGQFIGRPGVIGADIDATLAWDTTIGDRDVIVGVVDTGVQTDHPDLKDNIWHNPGEIPGNGIDDEGNGFIDDVTGWDFGALDNDPSDEQGHGTACAGMIGAVGDNNIGVAGVSWTVSILPLKIADRYGGLTFSGIVGAHDYTTMMRNRGVNIVATSNSYGGFAPSFYKDLPQGSDAEKDSIQRFIDSGGTFLAAAGNASYNNDDPNFTNYPSSYNIPGVISVAATDNTDSLASFSSYGAQSVDLGAPGVNTLTVALGSGYGYFGGTSAATPATAGAVALMFAVKPNASAVEIREALINSCDPLPALQGRVVSGGRLNVARALEIVGIAGPLVRQVSPGPFTTQTDVNTGQVISSISVKFSKDIDPGFLSTAGVTLRGDGIDGAFSTPDDLVIPVTSVTLSATDPTTVVISLNLAGFPQSRLPLDRYRLTLPAGVFRDPDGNYLNGTTAGGTDQTYDFTVVTITGAFEPNDTLLTATPVIFDASGTAVFNGASLGNGLFAGLDVDLYRVDIPRAGEFTAEVIARRLPNTSPLDSVLRLFNANGVQIATNDQFFGADSYIDFFLNTAGTYYIGVSGFSNLTYNPKIAGSGSAQSTGEYSLRLTAQLVADDNLTVGGTLAVPKAIPVQGSISDTIDVADSRQILDVNVRLDITHAFDNDLVVSLTSPSGKVVTLINRRGGSGQNFTNTLLDDEGPTALSQGFAPYTGTFRPDNPLSGFDGLSALGGWTLTITDSAALNSGVLLGWSLDFSLSNDIYGPFESNDTIRTATTTTGLGTGTGAATIDGFIGDGGFGTFDRDIFRIVVVSGTTLNATVVPRAASLNGPANLNTALRLFDVAGTQVSFAAPSTTKDARIENFVFRDGGIFYLAVSEGANLAYNPFIVTSGTAAASTGNYTLTITLNVGVSDVPMLLDGNALDVGVSSSGTFLAPPGSVNGTTAGTAGLRWNGVEFLFNDASSVAAPTTFFGASAGGATFVNYSTSSQLPVALSAQSDSLNRRAVVAGAFGSLRVERTISFGLNDNFIALDVTLTNLGATPLTEVSWMEAFNAEQGLNVGPASGLTRNDISGNGRYASSSFRNNTFQQGLTVALAAAANDSRAKVNFVTPTLNLRDPLQLLALPVNDLNGAATDDTMSIGFNFGTMDAAGGPSASVHARYFIFFGSTPAEAQALYDQVNAGTGAGHLTITASTPATETLSDGSVVPTLPFRAYYPEGYANGQTFTFLPVLNSSEQSNRIVIIARYETGERDQIISQFTLPASSRGGITITTPDMYAANTLLVRKDTPYAIEIRSESPVAATFSHYDQFILAGSRAAIGESFTTRLSADWTFGQVTKGGGIGDASGTSDFVLFTNTSNAVIKVEATFFPDNGGAPVTVTRTSDPFRRGGWSVNDLPELEAGRTYGVLVHAEAPIVAALSHYDRTTRSASGLTGVPGNGSTGGAIPEGQIGVNSTDEQLGIVNTGGSTATVTLSFLFGNGNTQRAVYVVPPRSQKVVKVGEIPFFPQGQTYSVLYDSTDSGLNPYPVTLTQRALEFGEGGATAFSDRAFTSWGFGEGFRNPVESVVTERLKLFNPGSADTLVEITIRYDNNLGTETFRATVPARRGVDLNIHDFITGTRRDVLAFYGITVKSATPIVASMDHFDSYFPGAFSTIGTPLGLSQVIS